jgi:hypothetical protein
MWDTLDHRLKLIEHLFEPFAPKHPEPWQDAAELEVEVA